MHVCLIALGGKVGQVLSEVLQSPKGDPQTLVTFGQTFGWTVSCTAVLSQKV